VYCILCLGDRLQHRGHPRRDGAPLKEVATWNRPRKIGVGVPLEEMDEPRRRALLRLRWRRYEGIVKNGPGFDRDSAPDRTKR
jgi:hypothetical protein